MLYIFTVISYTVLQVQMYFERTFDCITEKENFKTGLPKYYKRSKGK